MKTNAIFSMLLCALILSAGCAHLPPMRIVHRSSKLAAGALTPAPSTRTSTKAAAPVGSVTAANVAPFVPGDWAALAARLATRVEGSSIPEKRLGLLLPEAPSAFETSLGDMLTAELTKRGFTVIRDRVTTISLRVETVLSVTPVTMCSVQAVLKDRGDVALAFFESLRPPPADLSFYQRPRTYFAPDGSLQDTPQRNFKLIGTL